MVFYLLCIKDMILLQFLPKCLFTAPCLLSETWHVNYKLLISYSYHAHTVSQTHTHTREPDTEIDTHTHPTQRHRHTHTHTQHTDIVTHAPDIDTHTSNTKQISLYCRDLTC